MMIERDDEEAIGTEILYRRNRQKPKHAHTLTQRELAILTAKPTIVVDRAKIKWPKIKWKRKRGKTEFAPKKKKVDRKSHKKLLDVLCQHGRQTHYCEDCGQQFGNLHVHHIDGNPHNNHVDNLLVLCRGCHAERHKVADTMGVKDWDIGTVKEF